MIFIDFLFSSNWTHSLNNYLLFAWYISNIELGADGSMLKAMQTGPHSAGEEEDK